MAFIPNPLGKRTVNHKDGDGLNNHIEDLEWATHSENHQHAYDELKRTSPNKGNTFIKLHRPVVQFDLEGNEIARFPNANKAAKHCGVHRGTVNESARGLVKTKPRKGFVWRYADELNVDGYAGPVIERID